MEKFKKRHKRLTSLVLSAAMIFSLVPGTVGAKAETRIGRQVNQTAERDTNKKSVSKTALKTISADFKAQKFAELYEEGGFLVQQRGLHLTLKQQPIACYSPARIRWYPERLLH